MMKHEIILLKCKNRNTETIHVLFFFLRNCYFQSVPKNSISYAQMISPRLLNYKRTPSWHIQLTLPLWMSGHKILADDYFKLSIRSADLDMLS